MKLKVKRAKMVEAYFVSPRGYVIPVLHGTHISTVIADPKSFGVTAEGIAETYRRHTETMPREGYARDEILTKLLKNGWVRARIRGGYLNCQIGAEDKRIYKNILKLLGHLKLVQGEQQFKVLGLRVYIVAECWLIDAYDAPEAKKELSRRIR